MKLFYETVIDTALESLCKMLQMLGVCVFSFGFGLVGLFACWGLFVFFLWLFCFGFLSNQSIPDSPAIPFFPQTIQRHCKHNGTSILIKMTYVKNLPELD